MNDYNYQKLRGLKRKLYLIELRGGKCEMCGYKKNISAIEFHHIDPTIKDSNLDMRKLSNSSMEFILSEFEKCLVLCANCHREIHHSDLENIELTEKLKKIDNSVITVKIDNKCCDCNQIINNGSLRCKNCNDINRRKVVRPDILTLETEINNFGMTWCVNKYQISRTTIRRWLGKIK